MIHLMLIFIMLLGCVLFGIQLHQDPGYVLMTLNQWSIETSVWVALLLLLAVFTVLHLCLLSLAGILRLPAQWRTWRIKRRAFYAQKKTCQGLIEFSEGHWLSAKTHLVEGLKDTDTPLINYLTAARAAQELGDLNLRDNYLREAQHSMPEAKIAVELTQAQLQLAHQQWEQALATLRHLQDLSPTHPYVLKLLVRLYEEINDWNQLILLLPKLAHHQVMRAPMLNQLEHRAYLNALLQSIRQNQPKAIDELIAHLPKSLKYDPCIISKYADYLIKSGQDEQAEVILRKALNKAFHKELIEIYGTLRAEVGRLDFAQSFLKTEPHVASLHLCLGRLNKNNQLWGQAKTHFETSLSLEKTAVAYAELGDLLLLLHDTTGASDAYRQGLMFSLLE
ncbi:MAG: heme biosynthesis HemY N-terminal domain-containing protein [Legionellaceae bacterium]